jgi:ribosomal protein L7/L12
MLRQRCLVVCVCGCLGLLNSSVSPGQQSAEQVLDADKGTVSSPLKKPDEMAFFQFSKLQRGGSGPFPSEFTFQYERGEGKTDGALVVVANSPNGRSEYSGGGPFGSAFADKIGTVTARFSFSPFARQLGDTFELWLESRVTYQGKVYHFKISNSVVLGDVGQVTLARKWNAAEQTGIELWRKSITPPPAPQNGYVVATPTTKLLPGMPVQAGWMANWEPAEVLDVREHGTVLVKFDPGLTADLVNLPLSWLSVSEQVQQQANSSPETFKPSVRLLPGGTVPLKDDMVPLSSDVKLFRGTPLQREFALHHWATATVLEVLSKNRLRVSWDDFPGNSEEVDRKNLAIESSVLESLSKEGTEKEFADRLKDRKEASPGFGSTGRKGRLQNYPIGIAIPGKATRVTKATPLEEGTKLGCSWGQRWYNVTVLDVYDDEDKIVRIHWDDHGSAWDGDISRDCLIIEKKVLAALKKKQSTAASAEKEMAVAKSDGDPDDEPESEEPKGDSKARTNASPKSSDGEYELILTNVGNNRFAVIKVVVELTKLNISDAKELVENLPFPIAGSLAEEEALQWKQRIEKAGGKAEIK